jgi:UDP-N-acetylmuramate dehydrogenase
MQIETNRPLKDLTTFKIGGPARYFACCESADDVRQAITFARAQRLPFFVLGGGSNILVSDRGFDGLVLHIVNSGIALAAENKDYVTIRINAGETWDNVVAYAVSREWWGIENLSHIPGQAGAAAVQNIGAYGQQLSDVLQAVEVLEIATGIERQLTWEECRLGYRRSVFNTERKNHYVILNLTLRLSKAPIPNLRYSDVKKYFEERGITKPSLAQIRQAIIVIRDAKFPFPREEKGGNAGSFFKNVTLSPSEYDNLERRFRASFSHQHLIRLRELRHRFSDGVVIRIPTAFLIEACGLKGCRVGRAQVNETQPLVLLNLGGASAHDVLRLAKEIRQTIHRRTGVKISLEPELVGFREEELSSLFELI